LTVKEKVYLLKHQRVGLTEDFGIEKTLTFLRKRWATGDFAKSAATK
jgi:hypothetical protein